MKHVLHYDLPDEADGEEDDEDEEDEAEKKGRKKVCLTDFNLNIYLIQYGWTKPTNSRAKTLHCLIVCMIQSVTKNQAYDNSTFEISVAKVF